MVKVVFVQQGTNIDKTGLAAESVRNKLKRERVEDESHKSKKHKRSDRDEKSRSKVVEGGDDSDGAEQSAESSSSKLYVIFQSAS